MRETFWRRGPMRLEGAGRRDLRAGQRRLPPLSRGGPSGRNLRGEPQAVVGRGKAALAAFLLLPALALSGCSAAPLRPAGGKAAPRNPFGVMLDGEGLTAQQRAGLARELGVPFFRPRDLTISGWSGRDDEAAAFQAAGFELLLTVRSGGTPGPPTAPSTPPADLDAYRRTLSAILDEHPPALLLVEGGEDLPERWSGTPEQYGAVLQAAVEVARDRGIACANGGLSAELVVALTWDRYRESDREDEAEDFLRRAASPEQLQMMATEGGRASLRYSIGRGRRLLAQYASAGIDFISFHWYSPDAAALGEAVSFLREATGLQPVAGEMGQYDTAPDAVGALLPAVLELGLPYAAWFSADQGRARALQEPDAAWRENGRAFLTFMREVFGVQPAEGR